jgi:hypothetical protein
VGLFQVAHHHYARIAGRIARTGRAWPHQWRYPAILGLAPKTARRIRTDGAEEIPLDRLMIGDRVRVRPGGCS